MVTSLIKHERIETTLPKAKELQRIADRMITFGKMGTDHGQTLAKAYVREPKTTIPKLLSLAERFTQRNGGYTRIQKMGHRYGDNAPMAVIEYIDGPHDLKYEIAVRALAATETGQSTLSQKAQEAFTKHVEKRKAGGLTEQALRADINREIARLANKLETRL
ncbi:hypothetical protein BZG36_02805 [Bifiguratus adelaidae]|uniref:50S ribosomal protein L17 n=1 Tax=Bifiguratus adelaidae TaxID=1938954 RepID=A0A261Y1H7_9FUNG|nr:hypothetical protein BZG36_02805 [Bifiguratus adelaidae]